MATYSLQRRWLGRMKCCLGNRLSLSEASAVRTRDMCAPAEPPENAAIDSKSSEEVFDWLEPDQDFSAYTPWEVSATAHGNSSVPFSQHEGPFGSSAWNLDLTTPEDVNELMPVASGSPSGHCENQHDGDTPWEEAVWDEAISPACLNPSDNSGNELRSTATDPSEPSRTIAALLPDANTDEPDTPPEQSQSVPWEEAIWDEAISPECFMPSDTSGHQLRSTASDPSVPSRTRAALPPDSKLDETDAPAEKSQSIPLEEADWDETGFDDTSTPANRGSQLRPIEPHSSEPPRTGDSRTSDERGNVATGQDFEAGSTTEDRDLAIMEASVAQCEPGGIVCAAQANLASEKGLRQEQLAIVPRQAEMEYSHDLPDDYDALDMAAQRIREAAVNQRARKAARNVGDDPSQIDLFRDLEPPSTSASSLAKNPVAARRPASTRMRNSETKAAVEAITVPVKKARRGRKPKDLALR